MDRRKTDRRTDMDGDIYVLDVQALFGILWRRRVLTTALILLILAPGLLFVGMRPVLYKATSSVLVEDQEFNVGEPEEAYGPKFDEMTIDTQARILKSPQLAERTIADLSGAKIAPLPANATKEQQEERYESFRDFLKYLIVEPQMRSRVIVVSYESPDPFKAAETVNTHVDNYMEYVIQTRQEQAKVLNEWIGQQVNVLKEENRKKSEAVQNYRKEAGIMLGDNSKNLVYQQITDISAELVPIETQKANLQGRVDALASSKSKAAIGEISQSVVIQNMKEQASTADQEYRALSANLGPNHPDVLSARKRAEQARGDVSRETGNVRDTLAVELAAITKQETILRQRLDELNLQAEQIREKEITLESLEAEETAGRDLLENFLKKYEEIKSQTELTQSNVKVFSRAEVPMEASSVRKVILALIITMFAVVFGIVAALLLELMDRGIEHADDVRKALNLRLLGTLPKVRNPLSEGSGKKQSAYLEEIKRIYLTLMTRKIPQTVLFTAAQPGEGKSTTIIALARYIHSIRGKVIVVDANTDNASLAGKAGTGGMPGLADLLAGQADLSKAVHKDDSGLSVIPAGNTASNPVDILSSDAFQRLLETLKAQFDFILVDCAPVLKTTDAEIMATFADQTVLIVEHAKAPKKLLKKAAETLRQFSKEMPNVILTKLP